MRHPIRKYRVFNCLEEVNVLLAGNMELRIVYLDTGETIVPKIGMFDKELMIVAHSRLDSLLDELERELGRRWMADHKFYP